MSQCLLFFRNWNSVFAVERTPSFRSLLLKTTRAFPVGASTRMPSLWIALLLQSAANVVVFPVPAPPVRTEILEQAIFSIAMTFSFRDSCSLPFSDCCSFLRTLFKSKSQSSLTLKEWSIRLLTNSLIFEPISCKRISCSAVSVLLSPDSGINSTGNWTKYSSKKSLRRLLSKVAKRTSGSISGTSERNFPTDAIRSHASIRLLPLDASCSKMKTIIALNRLLSSCSVMRLESSSEKNCSATNSGGNKARSIFPIPIRYFSSSRYVFSNRI